MYKQITGYGGTALDASQDANAQYKKAKTDDPDIYICSRVAGMPNINTSGPADKFVSAICYSDGRGNTPDDCPEVKFPECRSSKCTFVDGKGASMALARKDAWENLRAKTEGKQWGSCSSKLSGVIRGRMDEFVTRCSCLLYTSPSPRDRQKSRMPSSA